MTKTVNIQETDGRSVTKELPDPFGFTYFVREGDGIKIGYSATPDRRIKSLETGTHRQMETLAVVPTTMANESETHARFAHLRIRGEWFRPEPELIEFIEDLKVKAAPVMARTNALQVQVTALDSLMRCSTGEVRRLKIGMALAMVRQMMMGNDRLTPFLQRQLKLIES